MSEKGNNDDADGIMSEVTLFAEYPEATKCISTLCDSKIAPSERDQSLTLLRSIWDKYLECPTLLDPYLEEMVTTLAECGQQCFTEQNRERDGDTDDDSSVLLQRPVLSALYALSKVRGRKRIQRFLPHEVRDVEPVLTALQQHSKASSSNIQQQEVEICSAQPWESVYVLWLWLDKLSLVPFDIKVLDGETKSIVSTLVALAKEHLSHAGPTRGTAASCLAAWLSRPDVQNTTPQLDGFCQWSKGILEQEGANVFLKTGVLQTMVAIVKTCSNRSLVLNTMEEKHLWELLLQQAQDDPPRNVTIRKLLTKWFARMACAHLPPRVASWRYKRGRRSLVENLACNNKSTASTPSHNESCSQKKPTEEQEENSNELLFHVPDQVEDAMNILTTSLTDAATVVRWSAAKGVGRITERLPLLCAHDVLDFLLQLFEDQEKDNAWHGACLALAELARRGLLLPNRLQDVVPVIVKAIQYDVRRGHTSVGAHVRDAACYTYWAFARAYAPSVLKPYVAQLSESIILACLFDREINCRRAASAAFQECVGRQGADNFKHGISILTAADYYSLGNRNDAYTSVARHVAQFSEYREPIIQHLYSVKLYHWDATIRNLASKSLHRLCALDAEFMTNTVVPFLLPRCADNNLLVRHGAVLGLAEVVLALGGDGNGDASNTVLSESSRLAVTEVVTKIEKARLYRGRGGEIMRSAVCRLIECTCLARLPLTVKQQVRFLDTVDGNLKHPSEEIQESASRSLAALMQNYFPVGEKGPSDRLQKRVVDKYIDIVRTEDNPAATRGFALALGYLPSKLLAPTSQVLTSVLDCLCESARYDSKVGGEGDAETRRNSIVSLSRICDTIGIGYSRTDSRITPVVGFNQQQVASVFDTFFLALQDYNMDRRGDVGSWSRMAAMSGLEQLTKVAVQSSISHHLSETSLRVTNSGDVFDKSCGIAYIEQDRCERVVGELLKQLAEKLDSVRAHAGQCLERLLIDDSIDARFIAQRQLLLEALELQKGKEANNINWANAATTFPMVMKAADIDQFLPDVISGMVISVGGLTESVTKHASASLLSWLRRAKAEGKSSLFEKLGEVILDLFKSYRRDGRVILPLLKTLDILYSHGCLDELVLKEHSPFTDLLFSALKREAVKCSDVHLLLSVTSLSIGLLSSRHDKLIQDEILPFVFRMLGHRFPRVRRCAADQLYMRLLEDSQIVSEKLDVDGAMEFLLNTPWDADLDISAIREIRNKTASMVGVCLAVDAKHAKAVPKKTELIVDEYASYASLVKEVSR